MADMSIHNLHNASDKMDTEDNSEIIFLISQ